MDNDSKKRYPTWLEWLVNIGVYNGVSKQLYRALSEPIPEDFAKEHGIDKVDISRHEQYLDKPKHL